MNDALWISLTLLAGAVAFLLSGMEAGVFALSRFRVGRLAKLGDRRALRLQHYLDHPEELLWTILVGNTLATLVIITLAIILVERWLGAQPIAFTVAIAAVLFGLHLFADLLPKVLFRRFPNRLCIAGVTPFRGIRFLLSPMVGLTEWISRRLLRLSRGYAFSGHLLRSRAELRHTFEESVTLSREELVMINRILDSQNLRVREVMTPMDRAATLHVSGRVADLLDLAVRRPVSFVPLWQLLGNRRRILGVVALMNVLYEPAIDPEAPLRSFIQPAVFVEETARIEDALRALQRGRQRLAVVLNVQRSEIGVVTLNDLLRALFGEVQV